MMNFKPFVLGLCLLCCTTLVAAGPVKVKKLKKAKWTQVVTENFDIVSDAREKSVVVIAQQLEKYRAFCVLVLNLKIEEDDKKTSIILSRNRKSWVSLGLPKGLISVSSSSFGGPNYIYADIKSFTGSSLKKGNVGRATVLMNVTSTLFDQISEDYSSPLWYDIGFTQYLSSYSESSDGIVLGQLGAFKNRLYSIFTTRDSMVAFDTKALFSKRQLQFDSNVSDRQLKLVNRFYAQSFLLVHYLFADHHRRGQMEAYLMRVREGEQQDQAFETSFGMSYQDFDTKLKKYTKGNRMMARVFDRVAIEQRLNLSAKLSVKQLSPEEFLKRHALVINEFDEHSISNADKQTFLKAVTELNQ